MEGNRGTSISDTCATAKTSTSVSGDLLNTDWLAAAACFAWRSCFVSASSDQSKDQAQGLLFVFRISSSNLIHWCNWWTNVDWRGDCILSTAWSIRNSIWRSLLCPEANNRLNSAGMFCVWDSMKASWPRRRSHSSLQNAVLGSPHPAEALTAAALSHCLEKSAHARQAMSTGAIPSSSVALNIFISASSSDSSRLTLLCMLKAD